MGHNRELVAGDETRAHKETLLMLWKGGKKKDIPGGGGKWKVSLPASSMTGGTRGGVFLKKKNLRKRERNPLPKRKRFGRTKDIKTNAALAWRGK